jgi:hypothetical protein
MHTVKSSSGISGIGAVAEEPTEEDAATIALKRHLLYPSKNEIISPDVKYNKNLR